MKIYKWTVWITLVLSVSSIIIACILQFLYVQQEFWVNVSLSIFGSSILTLISSLVGYHTYKRKILENIFIHTIKANNQFRKIIYFKDTNEKYDDLLERENELIRHKVVAPSANKKKKKNKNIDRILFDKESYEADLAEFRKLLEKVMNSYILVDIDMTDLTKDYGELDFFFLNRSFKKWIFENIYSYIRELKEIIDNRKFDFNIYFEAKNGNAYVMYDFVKELQNKFFIIETEDKGDYISTIVYRDIEYIIDMRIEQLRSRMYKTKEEHINRSPISVTTDIKK